MPPEPKTALITLAGPTASGKTALAIHLAHALNGEIISCDSIAVYRGLDVGSAKPTAAERAEIPHHCLDIYDPNQPCTAGDWARHARAALADIRSRNKFPIIAGGTGLYLRALLQGLAPAPPRDEALRTRLRSRNNLHRLLTRLDPVSAALIHPNDTPKLIRALEVTLTARQPRSQQWQQGREGALSGYNILSLALSPPRKALYESINARCKAMFANGLVAETANLRAQYGDACRPLASLGYAQAMQLLRAELTLPEAIAAAQQGHRNYAKRQLTWFRREPQTHWLESFGTHPQTQAQALQLARQSLQ